MRNLLTLLLLCLLLSLCYTPTLSGTTYYVSSEGNDASNGLSESTSWRTIAKVNSFSFKAGDMIYFKRGDTWNETLIPSSSGNSSSRITFGAYGIGAAPIISGFTTLSSWIDNGGGVYRKAVTCDVTPRMVTFDGVNQRMGRWPKLATADYYMYDSFSGTTQITDSELSGRNWIGGNALIRSNAGSIISSSITGHSGSTITFNDLGGYGILSGYGYFINNHIGTLTELGEWAYINGNLYMYFGTENPNSHTVKIAAKDKLFDASGRNYITVDGLAFEGGNVGIFTFASSYLNIQNSDIRLMGSHGIKFWGQGGGGGSYNTIDNNNITDCNNIGIETSWWREFNHITITNNVLTNIGTIPGMGGNMYQSYGGIRCWSDNSLVQYNSLTNIGYTGIGFYGTNTKVKNNFINTFLVSKSDGGGIYAVQQGEAVTTGSEVTNNIVINGIGINPIYQPYAGWGGHGIYMDDRMTNVLVNANTVWNCSEDGIFLHGAINVQVTNNKVGKCGKDDGVCAQLASKRDFAAEPHSTGLVITGNQFISLATTNSQAMPYAAIFLGRDGDSEIINSISSANNNYYAMPLFPNSGKLIRLWPDGPWAVAEWKTLAQWKSYSGKDANSNISQIAITNINQAQIFYNETKVNKIVTLAAGCIDVTGEKYSGNITLLPYTSVILFSDGTQVATPTFSPVAGTYTSMQSVTISTATSGATIQYTTDGSTPTSSSTLYSTPVSVSVTTTLKAIGIKSGLTDSSVGTAAYTINAGGGTNIAQGKTATQSSTFYDMVASRAVDGSTNGAGEAYVSHTNSDAQAWWMVDLGANYNIGDIKVWNRTDGSMSRLSDYYVRVLNSSQVEVWSNHQTTYPNPTTTVNAGGITGRYVKVQLTGTNYLHMAEVQVYESSGGTVATPTFSPVAGTYTSTQSVTISTTTSGAEIRYTTDGSTPTGSSTLYSSPVSVSATTTLKAIGIKSGLSDSGVGTAVYTITGSTEVNDMVTGTGQNQFEYVGAGWLWGANEDNTDAYMSDEHYTTTTNDYYNVDFTGTQIAVYSQKGTSAGITAYSIDGGAETNVDQYNSTMVFNTLVYTSPTLSDASHTLKVRVTGTKNASSWGYWLAADRVVITSVDITGNAVLNEQSLISVYPNPVNDMLNISDKDSKEMSLKLCDIKGIELYKSVKTGDCKLDMGKYQSGIYFLQVICEGKTTIRKIMKN